MFNTKKVTKREIAREENRTAAEKIIVEMNELARKVESVAIFTDERFQALQEKLYNLDWIVLPKSLKKRDGQFHFTFRLVSPESKELLEY